LNEIFNNLLLTIVILSGYTFLVSVLNVFSFSKPKPLFPKKQNLLSIIVPCRNEEENINNCVQSILTQDYENFELLLIDDNSTDNTWNIIQNLAINNDKILPLKGESLPKDWAGKNWACDQASRKSSGDFLLFIDADTTLSKYAVSSGLKQIEDDKIEFLTLVPKRKFFNFTDYLIWIMVSWFIFSWIPFYIARKTPYSLLAAGFGQFLLFNKEAYNKIGGHDHIKGLVLDDFELARSIKNFGFSSSLMDGTSLVETNGYKTSLESVDGHAKSIFATFRYNILLFLLAFFGLLILFYVPFLNVFSFLFGLEIQSFYLILSLSSIGFIFMSILLSSKAFSISIFSSFIYPIAMIVLLFSGYRSFLSSFDGEIKWKGRSTPSVGIKKMYTIIFFPFIFLNWVYKKIK
jgi:chlorobactene glucosyltransferase